MARRLRQSVRAKGRSGITVRTNMPRKKVSYTSRQRTRVRAG